VRERLSWLGGKLPVVGIVAFSGCSVNALANLFLERAKHPVWWLWPASALIELITAWLVYHAVDGFRKVTRSRLAKQDRRFYTGILVVFLGLTLFFLSLSVYANSLEFDNLGFGFVFPLASVSCAVGAALPDAVARYEKGRADEKAESAKQRKEREEEKQREEELGQIDRQRQAEQAAKLAELQQTVASLGETARQILGAIAADDQQSHADIAQAVGIKRQSVSYHLRQLEKLGLIQRNGQGVELLVDVSAN
jgi:predicted transcriptional regulator/uncharacterized membrane protein